MHNQPMIRNRLWRAVGFAFLAFLAFALCATALAAPPPHTTAEKPIREIFVPFEDLNVILSGKTERVFLTRDEYAQLLARAEKAPDAKAPLGATLLSANYVGQFESGRAQLRGTLEVEVLDDGLQRLPLALSGVGLYRATLDGRPAPLGRDNAGGISLLVEGRGRHRLEVDLVIPLEMTAAQQSLVYQLPTPPSTRIRVTVPGNVEVKSGAAVVSRKLADDGASTEFELMPNRGQTSIVMSLNNHMLRAQSVVVARSVIVNEVTQAYERLHARVSMDVLHGAVDQFRFALPDEFEVTTVDAAELSHWEVIKDGGRPVLVAHLREPASGIVGLNVAAEKTPAAPDAWTAARLEPLDVASHTSVIGVVLEDRMKTEGIAASGLIAIDNSVLTSAVPESVFQAEPGAPRIRPVATYYAAVPQYQLSGRFEVPAGQVHVTTNLTLTVGEGQLKAGGVFSLRPETDDLFDLKFTAPPGWHVTEVQTGTSGPLPLERYDDGQGGAVIHVRLPVAVKAGSEDAVRFWAESTPAGWLDDWEQKEVAFPAFAVVGAASDSGAVAVIANDDLTVRAAQLDGLVPLDNEDLLRAGLAPMAATLAFSYDAAPYQLGIAVERTAPWIVAQTYSFLTVQTESLQSHYEIDYFVQQATTRQLVLELPASTPEALSIRGLDGVELKEFSGAVDGDVRRWTILLAERRRGRIRLTVDFDQRLEGDEPKDFALPLVRAADVAFQSGHVAVEGSADIDVQVKTAARQVDAGEMADAEYLPGRRLLGAYAYGGGDADVRIDVTRHPGYALPRAIVQRAELVTALSASGVSQTVARYDLRTKAAFLEIELPTVATFWAALLDHQSTKPQRDGDRLLLSLPSLREDVLRTVQVVYEAPANAVSVVGSIDVSAPKLFLRAERDAPPAAVPLADVDWYLNLPPGYRVTASDGTVFTQQIAARRSPLATLTGTMYWVAGGVEPFAYLPKVNYAREAARTGLAGADYHAYGKNDVAHDYRQDEMGVEVTDDFELPNVEEPPTGDSAPAVKPMDRPRDTAGTPFNDLIDDADQPTPTAPAPATNAPPEAQPQAAEPQAAQAQPPAPAAPPVPQGEPAPQNGPVVVADNADLVDWSTVQDFKSRGRWALEGIGSLDINITPADTAVRFQSLGADPQLRATLVNDERIQAMAVAVALLVLLIGVALTRRAVKTKVRYVVVVALVSTLAPLFTGWVNELGDTFDLAFYAACLLVVYYVVVAVLGWLIGLVRRPAGPPKAATAAAALMFMVAATASTALAQQAEPKQPFVVQVAPPPVPVTVPDDAIIVPYDAGAEADIQASIAAADKLLIPYAKYVELWNLAYPDKKITTGPLPANFALAGATFQSTLDGEEFLLVSGQIDIDVFRDDEVMIPFPLQGGVLSQAVLDDRPARMEVVAPTARPAQQPAAQQPNLPNAGPAVQQLMQADANRGGLVLLHVSGKGRHHLKLAARMQLQRQGGWRVVRGNIPAAPATSLSLAVPQPKTELRLAGVFDRREFETEQPAQTINIALNADGALDLQWRPQVAEGQLDRSLTANSVAVLDVREDSLQLDWRLHVDFGRSERDSVTVTLPQDFLIEKVSGDNVCGWTAEAAGDRQQLDITLLEAARGQQTIDIKLSQYAAVGAEQLAAFDAPLVTVSGAMLHSGELTIRRSPILNLQTVASAGVTRIDVAGANRGDDAEDSPLGVRPYEAYRFSTTPFALRLAAEEIAAETSATVQTLLKVAERETTVESLIRLTAQSRPVFRVRLAVPAALQLQGDVQAPGVYQWSQTAAADGRTVVTIFLSEGQLGEFPVVIRGKIDAGAAGGSLPVPDVEVLDVARQQGDVAVQLDPAFNVSASGLTDCETILLQQVYTWLADNRQRELAQLALRYRKSGYAATLKFAARQPRVACRTYTNVRVTEQAIEETVLLNFTIREAGIRQVSFLLPQSMQDARISAPLLRQKTVTPIDGQPMVRVQLDLQDDVIGQFGVKIENDRLLTADEQPAPLPVVETGRTERRYAILENAGRDEVLVEKHDGLEQLSRQQQQWRELAELLGGNLTQAYLVRQDAAAPQLTYRTNERQAVKTAGATIGLAKTRLLVDGIGAYRGVQEYRVDNQTEQFLEIELPDGAELWTARVAGAVVKPVVFAGASKQGAVHIPLIKTSQGDRDYAVELKYGGRMPSLSSLSEVSFPLIRTVNINVEQSEVRLFLPDTHRWYDFGGTMTPVAQQKLDASKLAADLAYNTKNLEKNLEVQRSGDAFSQARAIANSTSLLAEHRQLEQHFQSLGGDSELLQHYSMNQSVAEKVESQTKLNAQRADAEVQFGNRGRLDRFWKQQTNERAKNVVQQAGDNFNLDVGWSAEANNEPVFEFKGKKTTAGFNKKWFDANDLENPTAIGGREQNRYLYEKTGPVNAKTVTKTPAAPMPQERPSPATARPAYRAEPGGGQAPGSADQSSPFSGPRYAQPQSSSHGNGRGEQAEGEFDGQQSTVQGKAGRYQSRLVEQLETEQASRTRFGVYPAEPQQADEVLGVRHDRRAQAGVNGVDSIGIPMALSRGYALPQQDTGLASLDVEFPERGHEYLFTTPRGDVEITARAIPTPILQRLKSLGWVLGAGVLIAVVAGWVSRGGLAIFASRAGAIALIVLGIASLLTWVLPVLGALAVVAGIALLVRNR